MKTIISFVYGIYLILLFAILILASFPLAFLLQFFPFTIRDWGMYYILRCISFIWLYALGMPPSIYHRKKINFNRSYLIVANHQSYLDAAIIYTAIPTLFKSLGKIEIQKTPIYGFIYKMVVITVDRSSIAAKANSFRKMKKEMDAGVSMLVFPEGTFPNEPMDNLLPFQQGACSLALMQETDILPVIFIHTAQRLHPSSIFKATPGKNDAIFLPPIEIKSIPSGHIKQLTSYVQSYMQSCLHEARKNPSTDIWSFALTWRTENPFNLR